MLSELDPLRLDARGNTVYAFGRPGDPPRSDECGYAQEDGVQAGPDGHTICRVCREHRGEGEHCQLFEACDGCAASSGNKCPRGETSPLPWADVSAEHMATLRGALAEAGSIRRPLPFGVGYCVTQAGSLLRQSAEPHRERTGAEHLAAVADRWITLAALIRDADAREGVGTSAPMPNRPIDTTGSAAVQPDPAAGGRP